MQTMNVVEGFSQFIKIVCEGRFWRLRALAVCLVLGSVLNFTPWIFDFTDTDRFESDPAWVAYKSKVDQPLLDMRSAGHTSGSHMSKLTPRILVPFLLNLFGITGYFQYALYAFVCGCVIFLAVMEFVFRQTRDRRVALGAGVMLSLSVVPAHCLPFTLWPFDPGALCMASLLLVFVRTPVLFPVLVFLALWSDERAIIAAGAVYVFDMLLNGFNRIVSRTILVYAVPVILYLLTRVLLAQYMGWQISHDGVGAEILVYTSRIVPVISLIAFEGVFLLAACVVAAYYQQRKWIEILGLLLLFMTVGILSCLVMDATRAVSYAFPVIAGTVALGFRMLQRSTFWKMYWLGLVYSALLPSFIIIYKDYTTPWAFFIAPTPVKLLQYFLTGN